jgi:2-oxoisovalerate dehydrogenase E1 component
LAGRRAIRHAFRVTTPGDLDERFRAAVADFAAPTTPAPDVNALLRDGSTLTGAAVIRLFDAQLASRHLDLAARWLRSFGEGFYTIGSSGHEGNAAVAAVLRPTDPALLHYRSGAFYLVRAQQTGRDADDEGIRDVLRGLAGSSLEPIAGGRHKVFGHADLGIIPTTSTIASHLPRAVGLGFAISHTASLGVPSAWPRDAVAVCSFGDASINHAAATAALNAAGWFAHGGHDMPVLFVCEDNGIGVSVPSPPGWVADALQTRPALRYFAADGCDLIATHAAAADAAAWVRTSRRPAVLHLSLVRLMGHAGADAEVAYRDAAEIGADMRRDPLVQTAELLISAGLLTPDAVLARYDEIGWRVRSVAEQVIGEPKLASAMEVVAPLAPRRSAEVERTVGSLAAAARSASGAMGAGGDRTTAFAGRLPDAAGPLTLAQAINATLADALVAWPSAVVFGEDVAAKGGVYGVTKGLRDRFGDARVFDTLLDETSILGLALGAGLTGLLPIPEIQYLAYLHSAEDQLRGEAASMRYFSQDAYRNPMVVRIAGLAYQEGFGGHFHNDNGLAVLRDIPGLVVACPARPDDAAAMLRTCLVSASVDGSVCAFVEPIALYHTRDLYEEGDRGWLAPYPAPAGFSDAHVPIGRARIDLIGGGGDLTIITFGNGVRMSLRAAAQLAAEGVGCRVVDMRWLAPLPVADIIREAAATGRVLIVDETRRSGGVGEGVIAALVDAGFVGVARRVASIDTFIPLGPAAKHVLVSVETIITGARGLLER